MLHTHATRNLVLWVLYDFANSVVQIVFALYFAQWVVIEQGLSDVSFNLAFVATAALLLMTAPIAGILLDRGRIRHIAGLRVTSAGMTLSYAISAFFALQGAAGLALMFFACGLYAYLLSLTFYTPLITEVSTPETRGRVSGYGIAAHYAGQIVALLAVLPLATGALSFFGSSPRAETLLPAVVGFAVCALPMLVWFRHRTYPLVDTPERVLPSLWSSFKILAHTPGVLLFLVAYFLFNDAILTATNNFSLFLEQVWGMPDTLKTLIFLSILVTSAIGGIASGWVADAFGHKRTLMIVLAGWLVIFPLLALVSVFPLLLVLTTLLGFWFGAHWTLSRSVMAHLAPEEHRGLAFSFFGVAERASSLVGPVAWGLIVTGGVALGSDRYRLAMGMLALFIALGLVVLWRVKSDTRPQ